MPTTNFSTSAEGCVYSANSQVDFTTLVTSNGTAVYSNFGNVPIDITSDSNTDKYANLFRLFYYFDTSSIGGDTVTAADLVLHVPVAGETNTLNLSGTGTGYDVNVVGFSSTPTSGVAITASDFQKINKVSFGSATPSNSPPETLTISLNPTGLASINTGGYTYFAVIFGADLSGIFDGTWQPTSSSSVAIDKTVGGGTAPYLSVTHSAGPAGPGILMGGAML